jgi:hypothetical protein
VVKRLLSYLKDWMLSTLVFNFKSPKTEETEEENKERISRMEKMAAEIIVEMRRRKLSYYDAVIIVQGILVGLCSGILAEGLMDKPTILSWMNDAQHETFKLIDKNL